jgi:catechol 2,3-dioxygenase-like lactoylglutathione lyase family enzyme
MAFQRRQLLRTISLACGSGFLFGRNSLGMAAQTAAKPTNTPADAAAADRQRMPPATETEKVTGIGGFFFRARDPKGLAIWYQQHLGVTLAPTSYEAPVWEQEAGPTIFDPFPETTHYFGDPAKVWMINFRVRNLEKMAAQLQAAGIAVKIDPQSDSHGRFARLHDPEGNPIELWQPGSPKTSS